MTTFHILAAALTGAALAIAATPALAAQCNHKGGFPAFRMEPLDFGAIYMARRNRELQGPAAGNA